MTGATALSCLQAVELDGRLLFVQPAFATGLGYGAAELLGRSSDEFLHPDDRPGVVERMRSTTDSALTAPQRILRADASSVAVEIVALRAEVDGRQSIFGLWHDPGQRPAVTAHMMQMDRMLSVGLVAAGLGHEINNPLSVAVANVDLALRTAVGLASTVSALLSKPPDPDLQAALAQLHSGLREIRETLSDARHGARRVGSIVRDLRAFSRPEVDSHEAVQIESVLEATLAMVRNEIRHRARLVQKFDKVPAVAGNEARLGQVFLNLLINAVHAIPIGEANKHLIALRAYSSGESVVVEVRDTGRGISPEDLPRIFEPFFTTKPVGEGTGLGLAICRNIVLSLGGTIDVDSELGRGTVFRVTLPAARGQATFRRSSAAAPLVRAARPLHVLVVDDEPLIGRVVRRCLGEHVVKWVGSGREALELLLHGPEPFDVVFLDVMMPDMTGIEVCQAVAKKKPDVLGRVVFLTGGAFTLEAREFLERIPNQQISKPFEPRILRATAEQVAALAHHY